MSYFPVLRRKHQQKFANPLTGLIYDNKKFQSTFLCDSKTFDQTNLQHSGKSKSNPHNLFKMRSLPNRNINLNQSDSDKSIKNNKVLNISQRLAEPIQSRCTRNRLFTNSQFISQAIEKQRNDQIPIKSSSSITEQNRSQFHGQFQPFKFPQIQVLALDLFVNTLDQNKKFKLSLKRYFYMYFKQNVSGILFKQLVDILQKYIQEILFHEEEEIQSTKNDEESIPVFSKKLLYQKILELQKNQKIKQIHSIITQNCFPKKTIRQMFLKDVINIISIQMFETYNCSRQCSYVLLDTNGKVITDFGQIKFQTKKIFVSEKEKADQNFNRYQYIVENHSRLKSKSSFRQALKLNFREKVAHGNYQEGQSPHKSIKQQVEQKRTNVFKAQCIVNHKNGKTNSNRLRFRQFIQKSNNQNDKKRQKSIPGNSPKNKNTQFQYSSIQDKIKQQFKLLIFHNNYSQNSLKNDQQNRDKIHLQILLAHCIYFKTKTQAQRLAILYAMQLINKNDTYEQYSKKLMDYQQYVKLRNIINCLAAKEITIHFVDKFLQYDQYGELQRSQLKDRLAMIIGSQSKTTDVILKIIWFWLERNGVIVNDIMRRDHMQSMFQRNKLVYYFLISLIFGTNQTSPLELAQEILV